MPHGLHTYLWSLALVLTGSKFINAQTSAIPSEMVGTWTSSEVRTTQFRDRATGAFAQPSGATIRYRIEPDGQYKQDTLIQTSMYNCTDVVFASESGRVTVNGARLILESGGGQLRSQDNCNARFNYKKDLPAKRYIYTPWLIRNGQQGQELCMTDGKNHTCYRREN